MRFSAIRSIIAAAVALSALSSGLAGADAAELPFAAGAGQGVFLHISDLHFDPFADPTIVRRLIAAPVEQWSAIFRSSTNTPFSKYGQDSSFPLLVSMLAAAKGPAYDYVLDTGDTLAHNFDKAFKAAGGQDSEYAGFAIKTVRFVDRLIRQSFPGVPLIAALGNNDSTCGDYRLAPTDPLLPAMGRDLSVIARHPQALHDYSIGGFYTVPHPRVPRHDIVVLDDVFWSRNYRDACAQDRGDPGSAALAWLEWTLYQAKLAGRTVSLVMHIPPGIDAFASTRGNSCPLKVTSFWQNAYARRFVALIGLYKDQLRLGYAGHTHMDDFRVIEDAGGTPLLATRMTPAVSPLFGNNPAFTVMLYSRNDASVADYATYYLSNLANVGPGVRPQWKLAYTFKETYGLPGFDAASLAALSKRIGTDDQVRASFMRHYAVGSAQSSINASNWSAYACAQTAILPDAFESCACPTPASAPAPANPPPQ
jgi:hypothetical protein